MPRARAALLPPGAFAAILGAVDLRAVLEVDARATRGPESHPDAPARFCVPVIGLAHCGIVHDRRRDGLLFDGLIVGWGRRAESSL